MRKTSFLPVLPVHFHSRLIHLSKAVLIHMECREFFCSSLSQWTHPSLQPKLRLFSSHTLHHDEPKHWGLTLKTFFIFFPSLVPPTAPKCWVEGAEEKGGPVSLRCKSSQGSTPLSYVWMRETGGSIPSTAVQGEEATQRTKRLFCFTFMMPYLYWTLSSFIKTHRRGSCW